MEQRRNFIVGLFVVAMMLATVGWLAILGGSAGSSQSYYSLYDSVPQVSGGTQVFFEGYKAGIVEGVSLNSEGKKRFRVDLKIDEALADKITSDSVAVIASSGLLGAMIINIEGGSGPVIAPGGQIPGRVPTDVMAAISSVADLAGNVIDETLGPLLESIGTQAPAILENLNSFTVEIETAAKSINEIVSEQNVDSIGRILGDVEGTTTNLETLSAELSGTRSNLDGLLDSLNQLIDKNEGNVAQVVLDLRDMLETLAPRVDAITRNLEVTTRNLNQFSLQIRENPGVLVRGRDSAGGSEE